MSSALPKNDQELHSAFGVILSIQSITDYTLDIVKLIYENALNRENIQKTLGKYKIRKIEDIKEELIDLLLIYINLILNDHIISENEKLNVELLKKYFKIKEGDFYTYRYQEVEDILHRQFERIYLDNNISKEEAIHHVDLQGLFNLSYDQFDNFRQNEIRRALEDGADIMNLDTVKFPKSIMSLMELQNRHFSQHVMDLVWNRENGKCKVCKNQEDLEFDHIVPLEKGGSNTYRNIRLICESCKKIS